MKKSLPLVWLILLLVSSREMQAQTSTVITITLKVSGNCDMCKERIETAAKGKGVKQASWDTETKLLTLTYDTLQTRIEKVHARIAEAGHDTDLKKAKNDTYKALPECCLYRDHSETMSVDPGNTRTSLVRGVVLEEDDRGNFRPLARATIAWLGTGTGTLTDSTGVFKIAVTPETDRLVISYAGYRPDTIAVQPATDLKIILAGNQQLGEVTLNSKLRSTYISSLSTIRTQVKTEKEL